MKHIEPRRRVVGVIGLVVALGGWAAASAVLGATPAAGVGGPAASDPSVTTTPSFTDVHPSYPPVPVSDCATTDFSLLAGRPGDSGPLVGEVTTDYNPYTRIDRLTVFDSATGKDVSFYVSVDDPACQKIPAIAGRIAGDQAMAEEVRRVTCSDAASHLAGVPLDPGEVAYGMTFNPEAAQHFVDEECAGAAAATPSATPAPSATDAPTPSPTS